MNGQVYDMERMEVEKLVMHRVRGDVLTSHAPHGGLMLTTARTRRGCGVGGSSRHFCPFNPPGLLPVLQPALHNVAPG